MIRLKLLKLSNWAYLINKINSVVIQYKITPLLNSTMAQFINLKRNGTDANNLKITAVPIRHCTLKHAYLRIG